MDRYEHLEPLPDIDFNVRAGNSLVGFATYQEVADAAERSLDLGAVHEEMSNAALRRLRV